MFCPKCQAEYLPQVRRCSDCNVPLIEQLPVSHRDSERQPVSRFVRFRKLGVFIILPVSMVAMVLGLIAFGQNPFGFQIVFIAWGTIFAFLSVFCDMGPGKGIGKGTKGYSLGEKAVREKLPLLLRLHLGVLVLIFAGVTGAFWLRRHTLFVSNIDTPNFGLGLGLTGLLIQFAEGQFIRRLLERALNGEQRHENS